MPHNCTLPAASACWAWITATSSSSALTALSASPVNGHVTSLIEGVCATRSLPDVAAEHGEGEARGAGGVPVGHARVAVLLELERPGPAVLDRVAEAVQAPNAGIPAPGEHEAARTAHPDHLVVDDVGGQPDEREVAPSLPDDLLAGRCRDQVREPLQRDRVTVLDEIRDRVPERGDLHGSTGHGRCCSESAPTCSGRTLRGA